MFGVCLFVFCLFGGVGGGRFEEDDGNGNVLATKSNFPIKNVGFKKTSRWG